MNVVIQKLANSGDSLSKIKGAMESRNMAKTHRGYTADPVVTVPKIH